MSNDPARCIPILASLDLTETRAFYDTWLGFQGEEHGDYLILRRETMELHFWHTTDRVHPEHTACYIRGGQVPALFAEYRGRGVPGLSDFAVRPWGMREFYIHDPHGNLLKFGCATG